jgi:hypothetical protein
MTKTKITLPPSGGVITKFNDGDGNMGYVSFGIGGGGGGGSGNASKSSGGGAVSYGSPPKTDKDQKEPDIEESNLAAFLADLAALTEKHGIKIGGCGCCGSPWLKKTDGQQGQYTCYKTEELTWGVKS